MFDLVSFSDAPPAGRLRVVVMSPFEGKRALTEGFAAGQSIADIADIALPNEAYRECAVAFIAGEGGPNHFIPRAIWHNVYPKAGTTLVFNIVPRAPGLIGLIASFAGAATEAFLAGTALGSAFGGLGASLAGAVVSFAVLAVGQALFGPANPTRSEDAPVFSLTGARNDVRPYGTVPVVLGTHRVVPPLFGVTYTEESGTEQYLRMGVVWGYGPVEVDEVKIGETSIDEYEDVEQEDDLDGTENRLDLYPSDANQRTIGALLNTSYTQRTTPINTTDIGITITFPQGLTRINVQTSEPSPYIVEIQAQYKKTTDGGWTDWFTEQVGDDTTELVRFSKRVSGLDRAQYDVRVRRNDIAIGDTVLDGYPDPALDGGYYVSWPDSQERTDILDDAYWQFFRAFDSNRAAVSLDGIAKSAFRILASDQLSGAVDELNAVVSLKLPTWNGSSWGGSSVTSNPAAIFRYILNGAPNARPVGGSQLNNQELGAWYEFCEAEGFTYDDYIDYQISVRDLLHNVAAAGRASPAKIDGKWTVIIQQPQSTIRQHFSPRNYRNFRSTIAFNEVPHGLRVRFLNKNKGYREAERIIYDDGYSASNATDFQGIDLPGQTDPRNVHKLGRVLIAAARLRPERFYFETDVENLSVTRGDLIRIQSDVALIGQTSGRIKSKSGLTVTLDQQVTIESGKLYRLRIRQPDGSTYTSNVLDTAGTYSTLNVSATSGITEGDLFMFGERVPNGESQEAIVASIEYLSDHDAAIEAVPYNEAFYSAGDVIPDYDPVISDPVSSSFLGPPAPEVIDIQSDENALDPTVRGDIAPAILIYALPGVVSDPQNGQARNTRTMRARWKRQDRPRAAWRYSEQVPAGSPIRLQPVRTGKTYRVQVQGISRDGRTSSWTTKQDVTVLGLSAPPPQVDELYTNTNGETTQVEWSYPSIAPDVIGYEVRFHPDQDLIEWEKMTVIADEVPRSATSLAFPSREGTYAIKALDALGNYSESATYANATEDDPASGKFRTVDTFTEHTSFSDAKFNCEVDSSVLVLTDNNFRLDENRNAKLTGVGYYYFGAKDMGAVYSFRAIVDPKVDRVSDQNVMADWTTLAEVETLGGTASRDKHRVHVEYSFSRDDVSPRTDPEESISPDYTKASGDAIDPSTEITRSADFSFAVDLKFSDSPTGTILEMGGSTNGLYVGITGDYLVIRAGDGSSRSSTGCAYKTQVLSNFAGAHGRLYGRIDVSAGTVEMMFTNYDTLERTFLTTTNGGQDATAGFPSGNFTSTGAGLVGDESGTIPAGEDGGAFDGTIFAVRLYNSTFLSFGNAGPTTWAPWRRIPGRAEVTARHIRYRVMLGTRSTSITPAITYLEAKIKTLPQVVTGEDIVSNAGSVKSVTFSPAFEALRGKPTINGQGLSSGDYYEITNLARTGFDIEFFDNTDTSVVRTFDYQQLGWGREKGT